MRQVRFSQILVFLLLAAAGLGLAWWLSEILLAQFDSGAWGPLIQVTVILVVGWLIVALLFRLFLAVFPLRPGNIDPGSGQEFVYHLYLLWNLIFVYPITRSSFVPVPLMRPVYQLLGARLGKNSYASGIIFDPTFVTLGSNCIVGQSALLIPHAIEGEALSHEPIVIGNNVTIGANAIVSGGVEIGDNALVAMGAVVTKGSRIGPGEVWGGVPAKCIRSKQD